MATYFITGSRKAGASTEREIAGVCIAGQYYSKAQIYDWIQEGNIFYSRNPNYTSLPDAKVHAKMLNGEKYIQTDADWTKKNNLLNLPDC